MATTAIRSDVFTWSGKDKTGRASKGEISAVSQAMAKAQLRKQGITPKSVRKKPKPLFGGKGKAIKAADIAIFTRQLATMLKAGVPLVQSFEIVEDGLEKPRMKDLVSTIRVDVASAAAWHRHCPNTRVTLMICFAAWLVPVKIPVPWKSCSTGWPPIKRKPNS